MKSAVKRVVGWLPSPVVYGIHAVAHKWSGVRANAGHVKYLESWPEPPVVVAGPFKGLIYTRETFSSSLVPSLLGTYELEIHTAVEWLCRYKADVIADNGAGEGYYAVGMALRNPQARCVGFEMFKPANHVLGKVARRNGVTGAFERPGMCTTGKLHRALKGAKRPAVICDCEGAEDFLLDPVAVPELKRAAILVELHDHFNAGVSGRIRERFEKTHEREEFRTRGRTMADVPAGYAVTEEELRELITEHRGVEQAFYLLKPRG
jgi:hypothetical protein